MTKRAILTSALLLAGSLIWALRLGFGATPWEADAATLLGADLVALAAVAVVGMLVAASRWARRLGIVLATASLGIALASPLDAWWWVGVVASGGALAGLAGTGVKGIVRERPAAAGPPGRAVVLILLLLAAPGVLGAANPAGVGLAGTLLSVGAAAVGVWYAKAAPGALVMVRVVAPAALLVAGVVAGWPGGAAPGVLALAVLRFAWTTDARVAVRPLVEQGTRVPIPPELAPRDILEAAGLDERGRRRQDEDES